MQKRISGQMPEQDLGEIAEVHVNLAQGTKTSLNDGIPTVMIELHGAWFRLFRDRSAAYPLANKMAGAQAANFLIDMVMNTMADRGHSS